jgi:sugar lactone lactonase YvrE
LNTLNAKHHVVRRAFFPNSGSSDAVPTCVAKGPGGNLYLGELAPGARHNGGVIFRYNIAKHHVSVWKRGFNVVDGCGFDRAGNFYAVELQAKGFNPGPSGNPAGDIIEIAKNGKRTVVGAGKLFFPQGFATDSKGNIYVSNWSIMPGTPTHPGAPTGEIVRISP